MKGPRSPSVLMSYPYSSLYLEAHKAKQRLSQAFRDRGTESLLPPAIEGTTNQREEAANQNRPSPRQLRGNPASSNEPNSTRRDMSASSFTLTLVFFGTIAAANTDHPAFWLLIGPAALALAFAAIAFLRQRLDLHSFTLRRRNRRRENG